MFLAAKLEIISKLDIFLSYGQIRHPSVPRCSAKRSEGVLIRSMLAAGIVQDTFAGEAGEGEGGEEDMLLLLVLLPLRQESLPFPTLEFHSQNTHARMRIRNRHTDIYIINIYRHD